MKPDMRLVDLAEQLANPSDYLTVGIDPGDLTGVVVVENTGGLLYFANIPHSEMPLFFRTCWDKYGTKLTRVVYENYIVYGHKTAAHKGSTVNAARIIGQITMWTEHHNLKAYSQMANVLPIAEKWSQIHPVGAHNKTHWVDAYNHAFYWLHLNGLAKTAFELGLKRGTNVTKRSFDSDSGIAVVSAERPQQSSGSGANRTSSKPDNQTTSKIKASKRQPARNPRSRTDPDDAA